jgi:flagellar motor switch protein FliM
MVEVQFRQSGRETRPQMLQIAAPNEAVIAVAFDLTIGPSKGMLNLGLPAAMLESVGSGLTQGWQRMQRAPSAAERRRLIRNVGLAPMPLTVLLETTLRARELLRLKEGDVLTLGRAVTDPLDVRVGGRLKALGRLVETARGLDLVIDRHVRASGPDASARREVTA